ncbi:MAG: DUF393 domain-containing protein [Gemmatimonadetes bacterium]|nr:DUF393 domain-containing protein [Gemmatimonadota bacterium]
MTGPRTPPSVLLYDGDCGLCARSVQFVLRHERPARRGALRFAPLDSPYGQALRARHPALAGVDSVVWHTPAPDGPGTVATHSEAVRAVLRHLGGAWGWMAVLLGVVPRPVRDTGYRLVARHRRRLFAPTCVIPAASDRARFLATELP